MFDRLFPKQFDNNYRGHWLAIWLFVPIILLRAAQNVIVIANPRTTLITADAIPLDSFGAAGGEAVVAFAVAASFVSLVIPLQGVVVLIRYRAMLPFMYLCLLLLSIGSRLLWAQHSLPEADLQAMAQAQPSGFYVPNSGFYVGLIILAMMIVGFALSLLNKPVAPGRHLSASTR
jgi:hypothetical protein